VSGAPEIRVNGEPRQLDAADVGQLVERLGLRGEGTAVALNGEVVPRRCWNERALHDGDEVEIVGAVQGG